MTTHDDARELLVGIAMGISLFALSSLWWCAMK